MTLKQSSPALSTLAAKYVRAHDRKLWTLIVGLVEHEDGIYSKGANAFFRDVRKLAASVLAQDERKGQHGGLVIRPGPRTNQWTISKRSPVKTKAQKPK